MPSPWSRSSSISPTTLANTPPLTPPRASFTSASNPKEKPLRLLFRDFGPGLSKQALKKLFQPFAKSATEAAHSAPGVGLGLALSRRLAKELGGKLEHERPTGRGATFCLTLPRT
jgi:signal transduction histidine kinase